MNKKILVVGYGRSGKDTAGIYLSAITSLRYGGSTSWAALPYMAEFLGIHPQVAWETRHENRKVWAEHCNWLRREDPCFLVREALRRGDIVTGVRGGPEISAVINEKIFHHIIWIDRPGTPVDPTLDFTENLATDIINNHGDLVDFRHNIENWAANNILPL